MQMGMQNIEVVKVRLFLIENCLYFLLDRISKIYCLDKIIQNIALVYHFSYPDYFIVEIYSDFFVEMFWARFWKLVVDDNVQYWKFGWNLPLANPSLSQ